MATYLNLIKKLMKPNAIPSAQRARTMRELVTSFRNDPVVQRLLKAGRRAAPLICRELQRNAAMPPLARACLFWVLCQTAPDMAAHLAISPLAIPRDDSAVLLAGLASEWIPRESLLGAKMTETQFGSSDAPRVLASILSTAQYQSGIAVPLRDSWVVRGITNSLGDPASFVWRVHEVGRTEHNWCTIEWPAGEWFRRCGRRTDDEPPLFPFLGRDCEYIHLDGSRERLGPTQTYYCAGLIWLPRRFFTPYELKDLYKDWDEISDDDVRPGDMVVWGDDYEDPYGSGKYKHQGGHWGVVWKVAPVGVKAAYGVEHVMPVSGAEPQYEYKEYESRVLEVRSKLSRFLQEAIHSPYDQALFYYYGHSGHFPAEGFRLRFLRWKPDTFLKGNIIDIWIKTCPDDDGSACSDVAFWEIMEIKIAEGPFPDPHVVSDQEWYNQANCIENELICGRTYRIWAKVRNRGDRDLDGELPPPGYPWEWEQDEPKHWFGNAYIRYYWAYSGCPQREDWNIIRPPGPPVGGGTPHFGPFTVPRRAGCSGNDPVNAPFAQWTPPLLPPDPTTGLAVLRSHLCFLAIVYSICTCPNHRGNPPGDDPKNRCNPDPIVYPWEPALDNNIAMRNVSIVDLGPGELITLSRLLGTPHDFETIEGALETVISHPFETARQGMTEQPAPLEVFLRMGGDSEITTTVDEYKEKGILFLPNDNKGREKHMGGIVLPYKLLGGKRTQMFDVRIRAPKKARAGSVYYVRVAQNLSGRIVSGCTIVVRVV